MLAHLSAGWESDISGVQLPALHSVFHVLELHLACLDLSSVVSVSVQYLRRYPIFMTRMKYINSTKGIKHAIYAFGSKLKYIRHSRNPLKVLREIGS